MQCRDGRDAPDVVNPWFWIECKRQIKCNIKAAVRQAMECCGSTRWATAVTKDDGGEVLVTMPWDDWYDMVSELAELKQS